MPRSRALVLACVLAVSCTAPASAPSASPVPTAYALVRDALSTLVIYHVDSPSRQRLIQAATNGVRDVAIAHSFALDVPVPRYDGDQLADRARFETYVDQVRRRVPSLSAADLERAAVVAMTKSLADCFSSYSEKGGFIGATPSTYGGIGTQVHSATPVTDGAPWIHTVFPGTPADRAGLTRGDRILLVNEQSVAGYSAGDLGDLLRGPIGSTVDLTLQTGAGTRRVRLERIQLVAPPVISRVIQDHYGYITPPFGGKEQAAAAADVLSSWNARGVVGWVLDLREPDSMISTEGERFANLFVESGPMWLDQKVGAMESRDARPSGFVTPARPLAVLVSPATEATSLVLATVLRDRGVARLIGEASRGQCTELGFPHSLATGALFVVNTRRLSARTRAPITGIEPDEAVRPGFGDPQLEAAVRWLASVTK